MEIIKAIIIGLIQGLTEFFPVSSSGHLVIFPYFFKWTTPSLFFNVLLHFATLLSIVTVFYKEVGRIAASFFKGIFKKEFRSDRYFKLSLFIIIATIPAAIIGFLFNDFFEKIFENPVYAAYFLLLTAAVLLSFERIGKKNEKQALKDSSGIPEISWLSSVSAGIGQAAAILPGLSRSGMTISSMRIFGINRQEAVKFSFFMSIPIIAGSFFYELYKLAKGDINLGTSVLNYSLTNAAGFLAAYLSGLFAVRFLIRFSQKRNLNIFALYCIALSVAFFIVYLIRR